MNRSGRTNVIARFLREWLLVATLPITLPLFVGWLMAEENPLDVIPSSTLVSALSAYSIAVTYAFAYDLHVENFQNSPLIRSKIAGVVFDVVRNVLIFVPIVFITLASVMDIAPSAFSLVHQDFIVLWSAFLSLTAAIFAVTVAIIASNKVVNE